MRKQLLAGTALVAAAMLATGGAVAADKKMMKPSISVGGFFGHEVGGILDRTQQTKMADGSTVDNTTDTSAIDSRSDVEVFFSGSATLDNGVKITTRVELEGNAADEQIDETFMTISGSFGQITLGDDDNAPDKMLGGSTGQWGTRVGAAPFLRGVSWIPSAAGSLSRYAALGDTDSSKITYISPKLDGFSVGMSYTPGGPEDNSGNPDAAGASHDGLSGAIAYGGSFGDVSISGGVGIRTNQAGNDTDENNDEAWAVAGKVGFGPLTVAAAYKRRTDPMPDRHSVVDLGARFVQGVNSFSISGTHSEADEGDASLTIVVASYARAMGPGVKIHTDLIWNDSQSDTAADGSQDQNTGTAFVTGILVSF